MPRVCAEAAAAKPAQATNAETQEIFVKSSLLRASNRLPISLRGTSVLLVSTPSTSSFGESFLYESLLKSRLSWVRQLVKRF